MKKLLFAFKKRLSTVHLILLSFLAAILIGTVLLALPISSSDGVSVGFVDALFTATTATCVTGLVVAPTVSAWSVFGQAVILVLIQIGGLGIITVMSGIAFFMHKKMGIAGNMLIQDAFNLNTMSGMSSFVKRVMIGTFAVEGIGALLYMTVFVRDFGARGIWISVFNSVSAFCNAGMDVLAENSLCDYVHDHIVNSVTCILIVLGGLGYIVWWDVIRVLGDRAARKHRWKNLTLHSKIAISSTLVLIFCGAAAIFVFEYGNPQTMAGFSLPQKIGASLFQSITTRTAGFMTIPQENFSNSTAILSILLMFIGGSPVGTAGGIKTVTFAVLAVSAFATVRGREHVSLFGRKLTKNAINKAVAVTCMSFAIMFISTIALSCVTGASALDAVYEAASATATVGLSRNLTSTIGTAAKLILTATMYLGRVGPISLAIAFSFKRENQNKIIEPTEEISVG